jgi:outer membrane lipoprotein-sorting protein
LGFGISSARAADTSLLNHWLSAQTNLHTWSADLTQTRQLKTLAQPLVSTGRVWFAEPNRFRWEIGTPAQTVAVRGSDEMLVIYPRLKRVERYPIDAEAKGQWKDTLALLEAGFPRSQTDLERQFKVLSIASSNDARSVVLQPKSSSARRMMPQITISFSTNDFMLRATELQFADGSTMRNDFHDAQTNPKIDESLFTPKIEPDFKIVEPMKR